MDGGRYDNEEQRLLRHKMEAPCSGQTGISAPPCTHFQFMYIVIEKNRNIFVFLNAFYHEMAVLYCTIILLEFDSLNQNWKYKIWNYIT